MHCVVQSPAAALKIIPKMRRARTIQATWANEWSLSGGHFRALFCGTALRPSDSPPGSSCPSATIASSPVAVCPLMARRQTSPVKAYGGHIAVIPSGETGGRQVDDRGLECDGRSIGSRKARTSFGRPAPPPPEWLIEHGIGTYRPAARVHTGQCWDTRTRCKPATRDAARRALAEGIPARPHCRPDTTLGVLE
ncbi:MULTISPECIES: DUF6233 domain-containing protein [unclassified Streptomyces]|uniref:DUF6233 domain-containing protein n=1 Tax=unclassified Streptomyces TaxID=2593676 RepID=UPI003656F2B3